MTKREFVSALWDRLSVLPAKETARYIDYYVEMLDDRMEEGMTEEEAVASLEPVETIAAQILSEETAVPPRPRSGRMTWTIVLIVLGSPVWLSLMIALAAVLLAALAVFDSLLLSVWAAVISLIGGGLLAAAAGPFQAAEQGAIGWYTMGAGLMISGVGVLLIRPCAIFTRLSGKGCLWTVRWMNQKMKRRRCGE